LERHVKMKLSSPIYTPPVLVQLSKHQRVTPELERHQSEGQQVNSTQVNLTYVTFLLKINSADLDLLFFGSFQNMMDLRFRQRWIRKSSFCLADSSTLKMEVTYSSETSVDFQRTTRRYIPEERTLHNHRCENLNNVNVSPYILLHAVCTVGVMLKLHKSLCVLIPHLGSLSSRGSF
jgi:hypothetical protein